MHTSRQSTTVFSLKFNSNDDEFEIIPEKDTNIPKVYQIIDKRGKCIANRSDPVIYNCPKCNNKFKNLAVHNLHVKKCTGNKRKVEDLVVRSCPNCNKAYRRFSLYVKHVKQCFVPKKKILLCPLGRKLCFCCEEPLSLNHNGIISCLKCTKSFMTTKGLNRHILFLHSNLSTFKCELCPAQCANNDILKLHRRAHSAEIDNLDKDAFEYKCYLCDKSFLEKIALNIHITSHERQGKEAIMLYQCTTCRKSLNTYDAFMNHICNRDAEKKFKCNLCEKYLSSEGFLQRHINTHRKYNSIVESPESTLPEPEKDMRHNLLIQEKKDSQQKDNRDVANTIINSDIVSPNNEPNKSAIEMIFDILMNGSEIQGDSFPMDDITLKDSMKSFLSVLLETDLLELFGWPTAPVEHVLEGVLKHCGSETAPYSDFSTQTRENAKLLLTTIIDNNQITDILNVNTIDMVIREIIKNS